MANQMKLEELDGSWGLRFYCGELLADEAVVEAGRVPNGYFWEGVASYLDSGVLVQRLELDSEGGMFAAYGDRPILEHLQSAMSPYLDDPQLITRLILDAGFGFRVR